MKYIILVTVILLTFTACNKVSLDVPTPIKTNIPFENLIYSSSRPKVSARPVRPGPVCFYIITTGWKYYAATELSIDTILQAMDSVKAEYFKRYQVTITFDSLVYASFPANKRQRVVITDSPIGFMGQAQMFSMVEGAEENPVLVWGYGVANNSTPVPLSTVQQLARTLSHELGHAAGLWHHGNPYTYNEALMGNPFYSVYVLFNAGWNSNNEWQDDIAILDKICKRI